LVGWVFDWHAYNRIRRVRRLKGRLWGWLRLVSSLLHGYYTACITLTYAPSQAWAPEDISTFIRRVRAYYKRRGWRFLYFWVAELQERGAVHFHIVIFIPKGHKLPKPDEFGWWRKGFTNIMAVKRFAAYLAKYLQKVERGKIRFPKGLRLFGYGGMTWFEKGMYRVGWLRRSLRERLLELFGVFIVTRKVGSMVEIQTSDGRRFIVYVGLSPPGSFR